MRFSFRLPARGDARFAPGAFDASIGKTIHVGLPDDSGTGVLVAADVLDGGRTAVLTVECCGEARERLRALTEESWRGDDYSFGFTARDGLTMTPIPAVPALHCRECGAPVTSITRGHQVKDGEVGSMEPARFGCGHPAGEFGRLVKMDLTTRSLRPGRGWTGMSAMTGWPRSGVSDSLGRRIDHERNSGDPATN